MVDRLAGISPSNADRAAWGMLTMATFARAAGQKTDLGADPETVLADLLADLMHWCDAQRTNEGPRQPVDFELALKRAYLHYGEEYASNGRR